MQRETKTQAGGDMQYAAARQKSNVEYINKLWIISP